MTEPSLRCPLCGTVFDPTAQAACSSCPLKGGCTLVCCPNCGYTTVNPEESRLARWAERLIPRRRHRGRRGRRRNRPKGPRHRRDSLADVSVGERARIRALGKLPAARLQHLQAYGVTPGAVVRVLQQHPMTIFEVESTELALERPMARAIGVVPVSK